MSAPTNSRTDTAADIGVAGDTLGVQVLRCEQVSAGRTGVYRVSISNDGQSGGFHAGLSVAAARVTPVDQCATDRGTDEGEAQRAVHDLAVRGVRVAAPLHPDPVLTSSGLVGFWEWLAPVSPTSAAEWGRLTAHLHTCGTDTARPPLRISLGAYDPMVAFHPRLHVARELTTRDGHPLHGRQRLLNTFESALETAVKRARTAAQSWPVVLVHGDNQPSNVLRTPVSATVLADFERLSWGPAWLDWAALLLGRWHYGFTACAARDFHRGYSTLAPIPDLNAALIRAEPFARIRELSGVLVAMLASGQSVAWDREMYARLSAITDPGHGNRWTFIGRTTDMRLTHEHPTCVPLATDQEVQV